MSFNLPPVRLLKLTKGSWEDVKYPATVVVQAFLTPKDYFEPVGNDEVRSCIPKGASGYSYTFNSNVGRMVLRGKTYFPPISVTYQIDKNSWNLIFEGRCMQLRQRIYSEKDIDNILTHFEHTIPSLLSLSTGIAIYCESIEMALSDILEARAETFIPPVLTRIIDPDSRIDELKKGIELWGITRQSARFTLASSYLREALYFNSSYHEHNPYSHSLITILKCAQAIEVLFGSKYDSIREKCKRLDLPDTVVETEIIRIVVTRNKLGSGHSSSFVPTPSGSDAIRLFATRAIHNVQQTLLHLSKADIKEHPYLTENFKRDSDKEMLINTLIETVKLPFWLIEKPSQN